MIKVLHVRSSSGFFGAESVLITLLNQLPKEGVEVNLAVIENYINRNKDFSDRAEAEGIPVYDLPCSGRFDFHTLKRLLNTAKENNIDCIHTHDYKSHLYGVIVAKFLKLPVIATLHGWISTTSSLRFYQKIERILLSFFDAIVIVSPDMGDQLKSGILPIKCIETIANGVDTDRFMPGNNPNFRREFGWTDDLFVFGTVARLSKEKGHHDLIAAFKIVYSKNPLVRLVIIGDGPEQDQLTEHINSLSLQEVIRFAGKRSDIVSILRGIDCYTSSSLTEGMPMSLLEAMACGVAIVSTQVGAISKMLENGSGLLVPANNPTELAKSMLEITNDKDMAAEISVKARDRCCKLYSAEEQAKTYTGVYHKIIVA